MSVHSGLKNQVIKNLSSKGYRFLKPLGEGGYASVLAFLSPKREEVAVKIIEQSSSWHIEEEIWPLLRHPNILPVIEAFRLDRTKIYVMPAMPSALDDVLLGQEFRSDVSGLVRIKKWTHEVLCALEYLHRSGFCHLDVKSDNVLVSHEDRAVLADFSGLNLTGCHIERLCSPLNFRPPECFGPNNSRYIEGESYDMWTFGFMTLNVLTGHWLQYQLNCPRNETWSCYSVVRPLLKENLKEANFTHLMKKSLPCANISTSDFTEARNFVLSLLRYNLVDRPSAREAKAHPFVANSNEEKNPALCPIDVVPKDIYTDERDVENYNHETEAAEEDSPPITRNRIAYDESCPTEVTNWTAYEENCPLPERNMAMSGDENCEMYFTQVHEVKRMKPLRKIKKWFRNVKNKLLDRKVKYVHLSNDDEI